MILINEEKNIAKPCVPLKKTNLPEPKEKSLTVKFISAEHNIDFSINCKNTDKFFVIEDKLYQKYNELREQENYFLLNGTKINKFKSLYENNINDKDVIMIIEYTD